VMAYMAMFAEAASRTRLTVWLAVRCPPSSGLRIH
jgi:hypothetical protein